MNPDRFKELLCRLNLDHEPVKEKAKGYTGVKGLVLRYLETHRLATTIDLRRECQCLHPADCIKVLRTHGHRIETLWTHARQFTGERMHRVGQYYYRGGPTPPAKAVASYPSSYAARIFNSSQDGNYS